jgi:hypothetical protein
MRFVCGCQLSQSLKDYRWAKCKDDVNPENEYIHIYPKDDFHWDGGLQHIIGHLLPKELHEVCEGMFEFDVSERSIEDIMKDTEMVYSKNLYDLVTNYYNTICECTSCTSDIVGDQLEFYKDGKEKCRFGYYHHYDNNLS